MRAEAAVPWSQPAPPPAALPGEVLAALAGLPAAEGAIEFRDRVLSQVAALPRIMRRMEADHTAGLLDAGHVAELWGWAVFLVHVRGLQPNTSVAQYLGTLSRFLAWVRARDEDHADIALNSLDAWQKWLALTKRHGFRWRARQVVAVRSFYDWRHRGGIGPNCAAALAGPKERSGMARKYSTADLQGMARSTAKAKLEAMRHRDIALLLFLFATGARREEVSKLDIHDLHIGQRSGLVRLQGKGAKEREIPFEGPVVEALRSWLLVRDALGFPLDGDALFVGLDARWRGCRMRPQAVERRVAQWAKLAGLREYGVHRFRVTYATTLYDAGHGIEEIRILLGHESIETTRRYIAVSERARRTRLSADAQHVVLGTRAQAGARWLQAVQGIGHGG